MIKNFIKAAQEACSQMGSRKYYDLMIFDSLQQQTRGKIADPESIVCLRDFMQVRICLVSFEYSYSYEIGHFKLLYS